MSVSPTYLHGLTNRKIRRYTRFFYITNVEMFYVLFGLKSMFSIKSNGSRNTSV